MNDFIFQIQDDIISVVGGDNPPFLIKHISGREFNQIRTFFNTLYKTGLNVKSKYTFKKIDDFLMSESPLQMSEIYDKLLTVFIQYDRFVDDIRALVSYQFSGDKKIEANWCHGDRSVCSLKEKFKCKWSKSPGVGVDSVISIGVSKKVIHGCKIEWAQDRASAMDSVWGESDESGSQPFLIPPGVIFLKHKQRTKGGSSE